MMVGRLEGWRVGRSERTVDRRQKTVGLMSRGADAQMRRNGRQKTDAHRIREVLISN